MTQAGVVVEVSQLIAGDLVLERESLDMCELVSGELERARGRLERAGCVIGVSLSGPAVGHWDRSRLCQCLAHLLSSAAKYGAGHVSPGQLISLEHVLPRPLAEIAK